MKFVYKPREDSFLLAKFVQKLVKGKVLDMGTGSGIQAVTAALKPEVSKVFAIDINPYALESTKNRAIQEGVQKKIKLIHSDLFENVSGKFDWIIFNPPYLPSEGKIDELSWVGGEKGSEIIERFLESAWNFLNLNGSILLICSSLSNLNLNQFKYEIKILEEKKLFFEKLVILKLSYFQTNP
jgi:release factor glutamine methyltransferase